MDEPEVKDHPKCFKCERYVKCAIQTESADDCWEFPCGLLLGGGGNYGSSHYDSMMDGIGVDVIICDECLVKYKHLLRETKRETWSDVALRSEALRILQDEETAPKET